MLRNTLDKLHNLKEEFSNSKIALHRMIEKNTKAEIYFAHLGCPGERGSNERASGELRRFFTKGSRLADITQRP